MIIEESGMRFGDYDDDAIFHIENSAQYRTHLMPNGVKSCEFILLRGKSLYFVEAKKSCPNQISDDTPEEKRAKYSEYIHDIVDKARHSVSLYASILLGKQSSDGIPANLTKKNLSDREIKVILIVKNAEAAWLEPLQTKLNDELSRERRIWRFSFFVINEQMARRKALIV